MDGNIKSRHTKISISNKKYTWQIETWRNKSGVLKAPVNGSMDRRISESVDAKLKLTVIHKTRNVIFQDSTSIAGLEMVGNIEELN
jgi:tocopherol cyclase